ncbi:MAG: lysophospholipid acyltransferase family protein [Desulfuromonadales bacterium]|nr:lysophospholipid acyltransferase family protein [Desulfuromonadales bacterium]
MLRTLYFMVGFTLVTIFFMLTGLPLTLINPDYFHNYTFYWARICLLMGGVHLQVVGGERVPLDRAVIYMPNHQGNFDIPALYVGISRQFRWLAKMELFRVPLFGFCMRSIGHIPIDRTDRKEAIASLDEAARRIAAGTSVIIFPEGTRSLDGRLQPFKKGGFTMAMQAGAVIVPVAISGSAEVMAKSGYRVRGGSIRLELLPPIETVRIDDRSVLMEKVRASIAQALESVR